jgi:hypothetical protein
VNLFHSERSEPDKTKAPNGPQKAGSSTLSLLRLLVLLARAYLSSCRPSDSRPLLLKDEAPFVPHYLTYLHCGCKCCQVGGRFSQVWRRRGMSEDENTNHELKSVLTFSLFLCSLLVLPYASRKCDKKLRVAAVEYGSIHPDPRGVQGHAGATFGRPAEVLRRHHPRLR